MAYDRTGREKEAVVVSLVRSNPEHEVGFLSEKRRLNGECSLLVDVPFTFSLSLSRFTFSHTRELMVTVSGNDSTKTTIVRDRRFRDYQQVRIIHLLLMLDTESKQHLTRLRTTPHPRGLV